ncbi:MAG TPA: SseB family protein [Gammaproteobacteria bacterium]|jgi:hypothetical protein|nr:SseB family protein [Gammaproteobacteria bacterium]
MAEALLDLPPQNEIEELLLAGHRGEATREDFMRRILGWTLMVLSDDEPRADAAPEEMLNLLCVTDGANRDQLMVAAFTAGQRAEGYRSAGEFSHLAQLPAPVLFAAVPDGMGVIINPNSKLNFRVPPEVAAKLREHYRSQTEDKESSR